MADSRAHYDSTSAPLSASDLVISGISGGDEGVRGFVSAYRANTGQCVWTFKTIHDSGDDEARTWIGKALQHGCGSTWLTGTYDPSTDTLFWPVGNPCPDFNGDERKGDNLYTDSVVALDAHRQAQVTLSIHAARSSRLGRNRNADAGGRPLSREPAPTAAAGQSQWLLLCSGSRGGEISPSRAFVRKLNWASNIDSNGRPVLTDAFAPSENGTEICPSVDGATNWMSTAYHPGTGSFYLVALEKCNVFSKNGEWWKQGESFYGGAALIALNASTGEAVWHFQANAAWRASPMTYTVDGRQFNIVAFALPGGAQ